MLRPTNREFTSPRPTVNLTQPVLEELGFSPERIILSLERIYAIDEFDNKKRNKIDLPSLPTECEVVKILFSEC
jgi:hypothetical protein